MKERDKGLGALEGDPRAAALLEDRAGLEALLGSREAQTLAGMLRQLGGDGLQAAAEAAARGDSAPLEGLLGRVMADPRGARAVEGLKKRAEG